VTTSESETRSDLRPSALAHLDARVGIGLMLLRAAAPRERGLALAMAVAAAVAAAPLPVEAYAIAAVPALLALAALIRYHADGLDARREALASAGARPADQAVIQATAPMAATGAGALLGIVAALATGQPWAVLYAPLPLAVAALATFLLRPRVVGAFALAVGAAAGLLAATAAALAGTPGSSAPVADVQAQGPGPAPMPHPALGPEAWHRGMTALAVAAAVLVASQVALRKLNSGKVPA
jgi:hypothetical protein